MSTHNPRDRRDPPPGDPHSPDIPDPTGPAWNFTRRQLGLCSYYSEHGTVVYDPDRPLGWIESDRAYVVKNHR